MIKDLKISAKIQRDITLIAIVIYAMQLLANVVYATDTIFNKGGMFTDVFIMSIVLPAFLPVILFIIGYSLLKNKSNQTRIFNSILYVTSCFLLQTISLYIYGMIFFHVDKFDWVQSIAIATFVQIISIIIVKAFYKKTKYNLIPRLFQIYIIVLALLTLAINIYMVVCFGPGYYIWFWIMSALFTAILSVLYVCVGYVALSNITSKTHRLFLACISATLAVITYQAFIPISNVFQNPESTTLYIMGAGYIAAVLAYMFSIKKFRQI
jgi:hypothetical protein